MNEYTTHAKVQALVDQLIRLGYSRREHLEREPYEAVYQKGTARVWFRDVESEDITVIKIDLTGYQDWKADFHAAPAGLVREAITHAEGRKR